MTAVFPCGIYNAPAAVASLQRNAYSCGETMDYWERNDCIDQFNMARITKSAESQGTFPENLTLRTKAQEISGEIWEFTKVKILEWKDVKS